MTHKQELIKDLQSVLDRFKSMPETVIKVEDDYKRKWQSLKLTLDKLEAQNTVIAPGTNYEGSKVKIEKETRVKTIGYIRAIMEEMEEPNDFQMER